MGYELHILRRNDWDNYEEESNISLEEWLAYVQSDSELELANGYQIRIPGFRTYFRTCLAFVIGPDIQRRLQTTNLGLTTDTEW